MTNANDTMIADLIALADKLASERRWTEAKVAQDAAAALRAYAVPVVAGDADEATFAAFIA